MGGPKVPNVNVFHSSQGYDIVTKNQHLGLKYILLGNFFVSF